MEEKPVEVSKQAKQTGEIWARWSWVEPSVWTERMLTALEKGVKGGVWFSLIDKVYSMKNLYKAFEKVKVKKGGPGVDNQTIDKFESRLEENLEKLHTELKKGTYRPQAIKRIYIPKPGNKQERRPLGIPTIRDRVVQGALVNVLGPIFEKEFAENSFGFRPGRGAKDALREVKKLIKEGYIHVVDVDFRSYFDSIPHQELVERIEERVADGRVLELISQYLNQEVREAEKSWTPKSGTPQGAVLSPLLSNIYLNPLDWEMAQQGFRMIRYADDFVILCQSEEEAQKALKQVKEWAEEAALEVHPEKTKVVNMTEKGFDFLGYHFYKHY